MRQCRSGRAAAVLAGFRAECAKAGFGGAHIMACDYALKPEMLGKLGIDSATIYNFVHWVSTDTAPDYTEWTKKGAEARASTVPG